MKATPIPTTRDPAAKSAFGECGAFYRLWCWLAFHLYLLTPLRLNNTRPALWLLQYAGHYAYQEDVFND